MASDHKREGDVIVQANKTAPQQVPHHGVVLVLTPTVVRMEMDISFSQPMYFKEVVQHANDGVSSFAVVNCLVNEVVDLTRDSFIAYTKNSTLPRC